MRIVLVASEFPPDRGGMESVAAGLAQALGESEEVHVFTTPGPGLLPFGRTVSAVRSLDRLPSSGRGPAAIGGGGRLADAERRICSVSCRVGCTRCCLRERQRL